MNKKKVLNSLRLLSLTLTLALAAPAQTKPDFSGTWKQNNEKSTFRSDSTIQSYTNKIEHQDPRLKVTTVRTGPRGESTFERSYTTDGKEQKTTDREGDEFKSSVKWEGSTLVFETVEKERGNTITTRETWTLSADGKTLTKTIHRSGPRGESDQKYVLEKQ